jgi:hypothetical protein
MPSILWWIRDKFVVIKMWGTNVILYFVWTKLSSERITRDQIGYSLYYIKKILLKFYKWWDVIYILKENFIEILYIFYK